MPLSETILVILGLSTMAMIAASVCRNLPVPYTVFLVIIGMALSAATDYVPALELLDDFRLTPDLVFFIFLPALIFESALNLDARQLIKDIAPILALAIPALIISTAIIGFGAHYMLGIELTVALLFGALIAATDPVAVVALFKELGAPPRLTVLVEGESLLNDATAIVIFHILLGIALAAGSHGIAPWHAVGEFLKVFVGGVAVGALIGFGISELMRRIHSSELALLVMSLVMAYASFVIAEHILHVSGVMAAVAAAVAMGLYAITRIPQSATHMIHQTWEVIGLICNSLLFLMMGLSVDLSLLIDGLDMILVGALLVLLARAVSVYSLVPLTTRLFAVPAINMGERHIMWWGGLKGGLAIAIVLSVPEELPGRQMLVELTLGIVLFTLLINAPTIRPLIKLLGIDRLTEDEQAELKRGLLDARARATSVLSRLESVDLLDSNRVTELASGLEQTFTVDAVAPGDHRQLRHTYLEALRIEYLALEELYRIDLIHEYTYLDMRTALRRDRDAWLAPPDDGSELPAQSADNPFARLERTSLAWMREQNWLAGALAGYQRLRITQRLQRDIAGILTTTAVIDKLATRPGLPPEDVDAVLADYQQRLERTRERLAEIRADFPEFYARFEQRMFQTAALKSALHTSELEHLHGDLGGKPYARIRRHIEAALAELPPLVNPTQRLQASDLIDRVPLFKGLPRATLTRLADEAQPVSFLPGDVVIEARAKGNALYIITQGAVGVYRNTQSTDADPIAKLSAGDFFGETALLGDDVRTATVKALTPAALLRLTRRTVLDLAAVDSAVEARLNAARTQRAGH